MKKEQTIRARNLRKNSTDAERVLWRHLRAKQLDGLKFRRQHPMGKYILDFVCLEKRVVIEVDGGQHMDQEGYDKIRDYWIKGHGYQVLRFWNNEVLRNMEGVLTVIQQACQNQSDPPLAPPLKGGE